MTDQTKQPTCATCPFPKKKKVCVLENGKHPANCPTINSKNRCDDAIHNIEPADKDFYIASIKGSGAKQTRIIETIEFAKRLGYKKIGMAFCSGLMKEAKIIHDIFSAHGLELISTICKSGRKSIRDISDNEQDCFEIKGVVCNPVGQALLLNHAKTEYNIVVGLCVGHDSLFFKYSDVMSTVLIAKDRQLGHNPAAAIYTADSFYAHLKTPKKEDGV